MRSKSASHRGDINKVQNRGRVLPFDDQRRRKARAEEAAELRRAAQMLLPLLPEEQRLDAHRAVERTVGDLEDAQITWGFVMVSRRHLPKLIELVEQTKRPKSAYKVVLACLARLERDQATIAASRTDLAHDCGITPQEVSMVMGELAEARIIAVRRIGRRAVYTMNPSVAWRGREATRLAELRDFEPAE
jgi:CRP-like cAMP-binding protein